MGHRPSCLFIPPLFFFSLTSGGARLAAHEGNRLSALRGAARQEQPTAGKAHELSKKTDAFRFHETGGGEWGSRKHLAERDEGQSGRGRERPKKERCRVLAQAVV